MRQYHNLLKRILIEGDVQFEPRTQEHILGIAGAQSEYDLRKGFPLATTKNVPSRLVFEELFWKLRGEKNVKSLYDKNVHIWDDNAFDKHLKRHNLRDKFPKHSQEWEDEFRTYKGKIASDSEFAETEGDLGPVYGFQWRHWRRSNGEEVDQLSNLLKGIKEKPGSRYHVMSSWNVGDLQDMALGPCPMWDQFTVYRKELDLHNFQRSCDVFLGVPFNIAQESLLAHMIAKETNLTPRKFIHTYGNVHIYLGVPPRSEFWENENNIETFKEKVRGVKSKRDYLDIKDWYLETAPPESLVTEGKDHTPYILEQLSYNPRKLPEIGLANVPLLQAIQHPVGEIINIKGYNPHKWKSKARMAA